MGARTVRVHVRLRSLAPSLSRARVVLLLCCSLVWGEGKEEEEEEELFNHCKERPREARAYPVEGTG